MLFEQQRFGLGCPSLYQVKRLGQPRPKRRCSNSMLLVNVCICLMIMMSQLESSLKLKRTVFFFYLLIPLKQNDNRRSAVNQPSKVNFDSG